MFPLLLLAALLSQSGETSETVQPDRTAIVPLKDSVHVSASERHPFSRSGSTSGAMRVTAFYGGSVTISPSGSVQSNQPYKVEWAGDVETVSF